MFLNFGALRVFIVHRFDAIYVVNCDNGTKNNPYFDNNQKLILKPNVWFFGHFSIRPNLFYRIGSQFLFWNLTERILQWFCNLSDTRIRLEVQKFSFFKKYIHRSMVYHTHIHFKQRLTLTGFTGGLRGKVQRFRNHRFGLFIIPFNVVLKDIIG